MKNCCCQIMTISVISIHALLCVHNLLVARATNSSFATTNVELTTMPIRTLKPVATMDRETTTPNSRNKTRDLSYVGHQLMRTRRSTPRTTEPSTSSTSKKSGAKVRGIRRRPVPSIGEETETDSEILRKFTSEQCFVAR